MRTLILLSCLFLQARSLQAQSYIPFPTNNTIWLVRHGNGDNWPDYFYYGLTNKDTTISGTVYHKLFRSIDTFFTAANYIGGIREDSAHRVYYKNASSEKILFDFSVNVGDSVPYLNATVGAIDSVMIGTTYHRQIHFILFGSSTISPLGTWVEGFGNMSLGGLLYPVTMQPTCDCAEELICFKQTSGWAYHNSTYSSINCDHTPQDVKTVTGNNSQSLLYPNPVIATSRLQISADGRYFKMDIYNVTGRLVRSYAINSNMSEVIINKDDYQQGNYYYHLFSHSGNTISGKFVVE